MPSNSEVRQKREKRCKRSKGLIKKAHALHKLCDVEVNLKIRYGDKYDLYRSDDSTTWPQESQIQPGRPLQESFPSCDDEHVESDANSEMSNEVTGVSTPSEQLRREMAASRGIGSCQSKDDPLMATWTSVGFPQGSGRSVEAGAIPRTSSQGTESIPPICSADHAPVDEPSTANVSQQRKKRKLSSDAVAAPKAQPEVHTMPSARSSGNSTFRQPHASAAEVMEVSCISPDLVSKLCLIGGVEVLRDLKHTLFLLRSRRSQDLLTPSCVTDTPSISASFERLPSLRTTQILSILRNELGVTEIGEQLYRCRKRLAQSRFFEFYERAQKYPEIFLKTSPGTTERCSRNITSIQGSRLKSRVLSRIVDLMFPDTVYTGDDMVTAECSFAQIQHKRRRAAAVTKVQDWRRNGKPWSAMIQRFGEGVLLLLPKSLSDENLRTTTAVQFENSLSLMKSILSHSKVLLRSANALSRSLVRCEAPAEIFRLENDDTLLNTDTEYNRQDLDALLEPCDMIVPVGECRKDTVQVEG